MVDSQLNITSGWTCFDVAAQQPAQATASRRGGVAILSGCLCQEQRRMGVSKVHLGYAPMQARPATGPALFLVPTAPSRSGTEFIGQSAAVVAVYANGQMEAFFERGSIPPVLHLSACVAASGVLLPIEGLNENLIMSTLRPLGVRVSGAFAVLEGELALTEFSGSTRVGTLPGPCRPQHDLRFIGLLLGEEQSRPIVQTVAVTLRPDGSVVAQGEPTVKVDSAGRGKRLQMPKRGRLFFDGICFSLSEGRPILVLAGRDRDRTPSPKRCSSKCSDGSGRGGRATPSTDAASSSSAGGTQSPSSGRGGGAPQAAQDVRSRLGLPALPAARASAGRAAPPSGGECSCVLHDGVVLLEGHVALPAGGGLAETRAPVAKLPVGCWPRCRMTFFTRGPGNLTERCRVDVDQQGRVFCPEGADGRVELTGIMFVAAEPIDVSAPGGSGFDDLFKSAPPKVLESELHHAAFDGRDQLLGHMKSIQRFQWKDFTDSFAIRDPQILARLGLWRDWNPRLPLADFEFPRIRMANEAWRIWNICGEALKLKHGINSFEILLYISDEKLRKIGIFDYNEPLPCPKCSAGRALQDKGIPNTGWKCDGTKDDVCPSITEFHQTEGHRCHACDSCDSTFCKDCLRAMKNQRNGDRFKIAPVDLRWLLEQRAAAKRSVEEIRIPPPCATRALADEVVGQLLAQWDVPGQLHAAMRHERKPVEALRRMLPREESSLDREMRKHFKEHEMERYEKVQQFFKRHETDSCDETHTSLKGSADKFTSTGKWRFPDEFDVQDFLFESLAWLYEHDWMCYISEKQSLGFPFIEDIDVQCGGEFRDAPPDDLIMECTGDPGEFMRLRAKCVHQFYPDLPVLQVHVYKASGWHKEKKLWKTSFHLVWPQLIVDADRAPVIRLATLHEFSERTKDSRSFVSGLFEELDRMDPKKDPSARRVTPNMLWEEVFDKTTVHGGNGLRMPYNDKIRKKIGAEDQELIDRGELTKADARRRAPWEQERRPSRAVGTIRFEFNSDGEVSHAYWMEDDTARSVHGWIWKGSVRRPGFPTLTPWCIPAEVASILPMRPGEQKEIRDGAMVPVKPIPQVRCYTGSTHDFRKLTTVVLEKVGRKYDELKDSTGDVVIQRKCQRVRDVVLTPSKWWVTKSQAVWKSSTTVQWQRVRPEWSPPSFAGAKVIKRQQNSASAGHIPGLDDAPRPVRPTEISYLCARGRVLVDGPKDIVDAILHELNNFTGPDDSEGMPTYDIDRIRLNMD